jgi:hypothetical protein
MLNLDGSNLGKLFYQNLQSAEDSKGALARKWAELKGRKEIYIEKSAQTQWKSLLIEFNSEVRSVLAKCNSTQGVLKRRKESEKTLGECTLDKNAPDKNRFTLRAQAIRRDMQTMARIIVEIGEIYTEVNQEITAITQAISERRLKVSKETLSGKPIAELANT